MTQNPRQKPTSGELVKFYVPRDLKAALQALAASRNVALSALLRLVVTEYVRNRQ
jgi:hypothetical protein